MSSKNKELVSELDAINKVYRIGSVGMMVFKYRYI